MHRGKAVALSGFATSWQGFLALCTIEGLRRVRHRCPSNERSAFVGSILTVGSRPEGVESLIDHGRIGPPPWVWNRPLAVLEGGEAMCGYPELNNYQKMYQRIVRAAFKGR